MQRVVDRPPRPSASAASTQRVGAVGRLALPPSLAGTYAAHVAKSSPAGPHEPSRSLSPGSSCTSSPAPPSRELSRSTLAKSSDAHLRKVLLRCDSSTASLVNVTEEDVLAEAQALRLQRARVRLR